MTEREKKYWKYLNVYYMTEESDDPDSPAIMEHKLSWRSESKLIHAKYVT